MVELMRIHRSRLNGVSHSSSDQPGTTRSP
jgi:hypothetical protein